MKSARFIKHPKYFVLPAGGHVLKWWDSEAAFRASAEPYDVLDVPDTCVDLISVESTGDYILVARGLVVEVVLLVATCLVVDIDGRTLLVGGLAENHVSESWQME